MEQKKTTYASLKDIPDAAWEKLSEKKIFFGHQSVGNNIIAGIQDLMEEYPQIKLNIVETNDPSRFKVGIFAHSRVGKNVDPKSKIDEFVGFVDKGIGKRGDAAGLKFCYVDIKENTDINSLFDEYKSGIEKIRKDHPDFTVIHFTGPLTVSKTTWKTKLKKLIGKKDIWEYADNVKRNKYNEMLLKEYQGKDPILDIAGIESTKPDGSRQSFELDGVTYYSMFPEYTKDGGHLNDIGRKMVAEQFLLMLANL